MLEKIKYLKEVNLNQYDDEMKELFEKEILPKLFEHYSSQDTYRCFIFPDIYYINNSLIRDSLLAPKVELTFLDFIKIIDAQYEKIKKLEMQKQNELRTMIDFIEKLKDIK